MEVDAVIQSGPSSSPCPCLRAPCPALARPRCQLRPTHQHPAPRTRVRRWPHPADRPNPHARPVFPGRATPTQQQPRPRITPGSRPVSPQRSPAPFFLDPAFPHCAYLATPPRPPPRTPARRCPYPAPSSSNNPSFPFCRFRAFSVERRAI